MFPLVKLLFKCILKDTTTTTAIHNTENISSCETETKFVDIGVQTKLTGEELDRTLQDLRRNMILQQKLIKEINE